MKESKPPLINGRVVVHMLREGLQVLARHEGVCLMQRKMFPTRVYVAHPKTNPTNSTLCHVSSNNTLLQINFIQLCAISKYCPFIHESRVFLKVVVSSRFAVIKDRRATYGLAVHPVCPGYRSPSQSLEALSRHVMHPDAESTVAKGSIPIPPQPSIARKIDDPVEYGPDPTGGVRARLS
ncbi:hypothetical protein EV421DRAFT_2000582 [Armillaria borealis]|uniref:Uncharacterized protein n=1 Tax=Armillaria borealis TaxID=47425 RepID=A0AA39IZJ3_9AGAR|nr:hypothetical protein EV421DRAFT_2000582 [Armillaria borealis]